MSLSVLHSRMFTQSTFDLACLTHGSKRSPFLLSRLATNMILTLKYLHRQPDLCFSCTRRNNGAHAFCGTRKDEITLILLRELLLVYLLMAVAVALTMTAVLHTSRLLFQPIHRPRDDPALDDFYFRCQAHVRICEAGLAASDSSLTSVSALLQYSVLSCNVRARAHRKAPGKGLCSVNLVYLPSNVTSLYLSS